MGIVSFTKRSREELLGIWNTVAVTNPKAADRIFDDIESSCLHLCDFPQMGRVRPDISLETRALIVDRWLVLYRLVKDGVQIVRIVDGARDLSKLEWIKE
jgi:toxin ParE1/3/4